MKVLFRFQTLEIWKNAVRIGNRLLDISDELEERKFFRFAEQLRSAALSVSNNIAEGSGSTSEKDFAHFVNIGKRSVFENANMLMVLHERGFLEEAETEDLLVQLDEQSRMMEGFRKSLLK